MRTLLEMTLRANALLEEESAIEAQLLETLNILSEQQSCFESIREKLQRSKDGEIVEKIKRLKEKYE